MNQVLDARFAAWLEDHRGQILQDWMDLVRIPSVQGEAAPGAPFGAECARALAKAAENFESRGFATRLEKNGGYAIASWGEGEKTIGMFGHSDVVPTGDGWLYTQPFEPLIKDGMLIGRGSSDNKSGVMASLCIMEMLRDCDVKLHSRLQAFVGSNEESGMGDIAAYAERETMPDLCLVPDSQFPCGLGEKGILRMWAKCQKKLTAVRNVCGGDAFNIVLDRATAELERDDALFAQLQADCADSGCTVEMTPNGIRVEAVGVAKHAAYPDGGVNAAWLLAKLLAGCEALPQTDREIFATLEAFQASHWGEGFGVQHEDSHFGRLTAVCGMVKVEDGHLMVSIDSRYGTECDGAVLENTLVRRWQEAGWDTVYMENRQGYLVDESSPVPAMLTALYRQMTGRENGCYYMSGGTYGRYLRNTFIVGTYALPADRAPGMVMPAGHGGAHQRDEAIDIEGFFLAVRILAQYVLACDRLLQEQ